MAYRINYGKYVVKTDVLRMRKKRNITNWIYAVITLVVLVSAVSCKKVRYFLLPGDPQVTENALAELAADLMEGESVYDAVTAFHREIIKNA